MPNQVVQSLGLPYLLMSLTEWSDFLTEGHTVLFRRPLSLLDAA